MHVLNFLATSHMIQWMIVSARNFFRVKGLCILSLSLKIISIPNHIRKLLKLRRYIISVDLLSDPVYDPLDCTAVLAMHLDEDF